MSQSVIWAIYFTSSQIMSQRQLKPNTITTRVMSLHNKVHCKPKGV